MTAISTVSTTSPATANRTSWRSLLLISLVATVLAAAATETLTAIVRAGGVHLAVGDPGGNASSVVAVNAGACAITITMTMVLGFALASLIKWRSARPARTYRIVTSVLVALSLLAPLTAAATSGATKVTLIAAHLIAAAIIVPLVSSRLANNK